MSFSLQIMISTVVLLSGMFIGTYLPWVYDRIIVDLYRIVVYYGILQGSRVIYRIPWEFLGYTTGILQVPV